MRAPLEIAFRPKRPGELYPFAQFLLRRVSHDSPETMAMDCHVYSGQVTEPSGPHLAAIHPRWASQVGFNIEHLE